VYNSGLCTQQNIARSVLENNKNINNLFSPPSPRSKRFFFSLLTPPFPVSIAEKANAPPTPPRPDIISKPSTSTLLNSTPATGKSDPPPHPHPAHNIETKILNNNMNPGEKKETRSFRCFSALSSSSSALLLLALRSLTLSLGFIHTRRVKCLLLRCVNIVCWRTKNVYYPLALSSPPSLHRRP
jgi:hypothetical protein